MSADVKSKSGGEAALNVQIDASCRWPVLYFIAKAAGWMVIGLLFLLITSIKYHGPGFLSDTSWLGLGRVRPAAMTALVYGSAVQFGFAMLLWILCRLGRVPLQNGPMVFLAAVLWNIGVLFGFIGILAGASTGIPYLEMPRVAWPFLLISVIMISLWGLLTFHARREHKLYVSQWFLVAALFWLPWILTVGGTLVVFTPLRGVMQAVVGAWFAHNLLMVWLLSLGMAALYYFMPKGVNRPLSSRETAMLGFWILVLFGGLGGVARLAGGPIPNWMISVGVASNVFLLIPVLTLHWTLYETMGKDCGPIKERMGYKFMMLGSLFLIAGVALQMLISFRVVGQLTLFTLIPVAIDHIILFGFFGLVAMGVAYEIVPRLANLDWPCEKLVKWHYQGTVYGLAVYLIALILGGLVHGFRMNNPDAEFLKVVKSTYPFLGLATLGVLGILAGQLAFLWSIHKITWALLTPYCESMARAIGCCQDDGNQTKKGGARS